MRGAVLVVTLAAATAGTSALAQPALTGPQIAERVGWLEANATRIASIDPEHDDFADLQPLKEKIGRARVVLLGEQTHGDGAVFVAKDRLVRFLHQEMGFDVLAWESPLYEVRQMERRLRDHTIPLDEATASGVFQIWTYSAQVRPVFEYARTTHGTERPLEMAGFDMQTGDPQWLADAKAMFAALGADALPDDISAVLEEAPPSPTGQGATAAQLAAYRERLSKVGPFMDEHAAALAEAHTQREYDFMRRSLRDRLAMLESTQQRLASQEGGPEPDHWRRDQLMGENLVWLANERYKDRKIIVWLATMHAVHDAPSIEFPGRPGFYAETVTAGSVAKPILGDDMYTIGFTALEGTAGNVWSDRGWPLPPAPFGSLEALAGMAGHPFLFVDFAGLPQDAGDSPHWLREPISMRPLGNVDMKAVWPRQMDAVVFIRTMFPSTRGGRVPEGYVLTVEP